MQYKYGEIKPTTSPKHPTNNRFSSLAEDTDLMETEAFGLSQAQLKEEFKDNLPANILENKPSGNFGMMDISTAEDAQDISVSLLNNSMTVTPTSSTNPYYRSTCSGDQQTLAQCLNRAEDTKE